MNEAIIGYSVIRIPTTQEVLQELNSNIIPRRHSSAARFKVLVNILLSEKLGTIGDFFLVTSKAHHTKDIVYVHEDGNLACTSPYFCQYGIPKKHILAVYYHGFINIDLIRHCHEIYHKAFINSIDESRSKQAVTIRKVTNVVPKNISSASISWNWCFQVTTNDWEIHGLNMPAYETILHPTVQSIQDKPLSKKETINKNWYKLVDHLASNEAAFDRTIAFFNNEEAIIRTNANNKFDCQGIDFTAPPPRINSKSTARKRRKTESRSAVKKSKK